MIAIEMRFLAGRFHATPWGHHVNEGVVEWPPSIWRFLRALIATYFRARPAGVTEEQLSRILAALSKPPSFHLPSAATAHTRHYDTANNGVKFFDTFVALDPSSPVLLQWTDSELSDEDRRALSVLLDSLGTFGRAESWCEAALLDKKPAVNINSVPLEEGQSLEGLEPVRMMMPNASEDDLLKALMIETSRMRMEKRLNPPGTHWVTYTRGADALRIRRSQERKAPQVKISVARYTLDSTVLPLAQDALPFAEQVRRALIRNRTDTSHSEAITGKTIDGAPLEGHEHAHYFATDEDGDGRLDHVTIYAPCGFSLEDAEALGAMRSIFRRGNRPDVSMVLTGLGNREQFSQVPTFARSRRWRSVTPFSLPRFSNRGGGKPPRPRDLPEAQLQRELRLRGLPEAVSIKRIEGYEINHRPMVRWLDFHTRRLKGDAGHGLAGFEIEFDEAVQGPFALGFACHFGLGLFAPSDSR
jgi:CRISPR-associated protein Csb2